ncbi:MAG: carbonic anhydrase [Proteobacteria bacterium]|nr:carbonic anhydrase [Pseudomonadota bacterium]
MKINEALQKLIEGNRRFAASESLYPNQTAERRTEVSKGQKPFAVIVGCSDSRVPPEIIFDQGLGDLFIIRVAGNIVDEVALGSIEYAVDHLGTELVLVLGHGNCGAITASVKGGKVRGHVGSIVRAITPAVKKAKKQPGDLIDNSIKTNVKLIVNQIRSSKPILSKLVKEDKLKIVGAYYNIENGVVDIITN